MSEENQNKDNIIIREIPHNELAEQMLLGVLLTNNENYTNISDFLKEDHFYLEVHKRIFSAIAQLVDKGMLANHITLKNYFDQDKLLKEIGGIEYLVKLSSMATSIINVNDYGKMIVDLYLKRRLINLGEDIVNEAYTHHIDISGLKQLEKAEQELFSLAETGKDNKSGFVHLKDNLLQSLNKIQNAFKQKESVTGISTGFTDLDKLLGGFQNSDLVILAGRPSMGKTAIVINLAYNACKYIQKLWLNSKKTDKPISVGVFSLEMSGEQLATRLISMMSGINTSILRNGQINQEDFAKVVNANKELYQLPFFIDDTPALSIAALRTRARRLKRKHNLGMLIIDYLQLLRGSSRASEANRVQEISEITMGLKTIAKELDIPVIALSQLSRAVEQRDDKRPLLSDLRESGSIEQDADIVMFIYREDYYLIRKQPKIDTIEHQKWQGEMDQVMNVTELIVAKHRNGPIGSAKIYFDAKTTKFTNFVDNKQF
jgi:replicative DNA helicase